MFVLVHAVLQDLCPRVKLMSRSIADPDQDRAQVLVPSSQVTELFLLNWKCTSECRFYSGPFYTDTYSDSKILNLI